MSSDIAKAARDVLGQLVSSGLRYALVGGFAVSVRTEPRFTRDLDLVVAVSDDDAAESLVRDLLSLGHRMLGIVESELTERIAIAQLEHPDGARFDLLFASSGIEDEVATSAETIDVLPGLRLPVATVGDLIALKLLSVDDVTRPQDRVDLAALRRTAGPDDLLVARRSVTTITDRGFDRGRDLAADLDALIALDI